jgi:hypothetical protein
MFLVKPDDTQEWWQNGKRHRLDGPAWIHPDGSQEWHQNGKRHRLDGPAVIWADGYQVWYQDGMVHRLDGPAMIYHSGDQLWYQEGLCHRVDGPAIINSDGTKEVRVWGEIPRIWNDHIVTVDQLDLEFPSARHLPDFVNKVWWIDDLEERTLAILKYS